MADHVSVLATQAQRDTEEMALWFIEQRSARHARERSRAILLGDAVAGTADGRALLERALDEWIMFLAMRIANCDVARPKMVWNADNAARVWLGHVYPGALAAIENPDNTNREARIDGGFAYEVRGRFGPNPASFSLTMEHHEGWHNGIGQHVDALPGGTIEANVDGRFIVTIDASPANGRRNHLQTQPGALYLYARDSQFDWEQSIAELEIVLIEGQPAPQRSRDDLLEEFAANIESWVRYWCGFKDWFLETPDYNQLVGPRGREGGWGYLAGGKFKIAADEALIVTIHDGGAEYTGFQISDPWTMSPNPAYRLVSRNKSCSKPNADGSFTYIVAPVDPGLYNWVDTGGLSTGWFLVRWQGDFSKGKPADMVREVKLVKSSALAQLLPDAATATIADRNKEIAQRLRRTARRIA